MEPQHESIQSRDDTSAATAFRNEVAQNAERRIQEESLRIEARVRQIIQTLKSRLASGRVEFASEDLETLHWYLWHDPDRDALLHPESDLDPWAQIAFREAHRDRERGVRPDPEREAQALVEVAEAADYLSSVNDPTRWAPVYLEPPSWLDHLEANDPEDMTPVGRRRIGHDDPATIEDRQVEIPHRNCDHVLAVAGPRSGKDSTLVTLGANLKRECGYKLVAVQDDGRMETPMIAIPNDEDPIQQNLDRLGQLPRGYKCRVWVPRMGDIPEKLPANHRLFTIGIDDLSPELILRLGGVTGGDDSTEDRIREALEETLNHTGEARELINRLIAHSKQMDTTIEWEETHDRNQGTETYTVDFEVQQEQAIRDAAQRLARLAGAGLIASQGAETNIDVEQMMLEQDRYAVLNCNYLDSGQGGLEYVIMDLWLRLLFRARDEQPGRLPRVATEIREIKDIAPTNNVMGSRHRDAIRTLRQTIFDIATRGGSRGMMMLASTQKLNDVFKPVRTNMLTKILLRIDEEAIQTIDRAYDLTDAAKAQLAEFTVGMGMTIFGGRPEYPIEWRGAPCGLGFKDRNWLHRYGLAWGARVREHKYEGWRGSMDDPDWYIDANTGDVFAVDEVGSPDVGEWYLLPCDLEEHIPADCDPLDDERIPYAAVDDALAERREYPVPSTLRLVPTDYEESTRTISYLESTDGELADGTSVADEYGIPQSLRTWLTKQTDMVDRFVRVLEAVDAGEYTRLGDLADDVAVNHNTLRRYNTHEDKLAPLLEKDDDTGEYDLTPLGDRALGVEWDKVMEAME